MAFEDGVFATGRPAFDDVLMIKIQVPNQNDCVPRPVREEDKIRFPQSWKAYETGKEPVPSGMPVQEWTALTVSELKVLQACQVRTVEQLAELADAGLHRLGAGGMELKQRAQKYVTDSVSGESLKQENADLKQRVDELEEAIASLQEKKKAKRKRHKVAA
jgi:hypothetical protein